MPDPRLTVASRTQVRVIRNRHGSGRGAMNRWFALGYWANPIQLGPDKFHCYGLWLLTKGRRLLLKPVRLDVEFTARTITIVRHREKPDA